MTDVTSAIAPKSDQLNADDLIGGPRTIRITDVKVQATPEQPIWISFEGDGGRPWKPCKTAARCLASIWGTQSAQWIGMACTIYNDQSVTWGGAAVGGIRVSHMEGVKSPTTLQLTKTRGKKGAVVIKPLASAKPASTDAAPQIDYIASAKDAARNGKAAFAAWWAANPDGRDVVMPIKDDLAKLRDEAEAAMQQIGYDDEPPL